MTDPKRLGEEETTEFERALLRSWKRESPPASARARALAIAGLAAGTSAAPGAPAAPASKAAAGKLLSLAKWSLGAAIGVGLVGAGVALLRPSAPSSAAATSSEPPAALVPPTAGEPPAVSAPPVAPAPAPSGPVTRAPIPVQASGPPVPAPAAAASPPRPKSAAPRSRSAPVASTDTLGEQVAMIDRARDALGAGDAAGCLSALDAYDRRFPRSAMGEEATVLRIEALIRLGDRARAADLGRRFLASRPTSPHAAGVRALLGATTEP
ncbi:hypothetical protein [Sorangium cellulosum]|uniref:hypothetical protein n=1 Tax=Sorangium cellulosum TaxID=56 RepID=UPI00042A1F80|nr:hypothetical protein [Sorangium cellulosum]